MMQNVELPVYDVKREEGKPVVFITGDSTVKNVDRDKDGMWGWVSQAGMIFDDTKITYTNVAVSGRSARNYIRERRWEKSTTHCNLAISSSCNSGTTTSATRKSVAQS